MATTTWRGGPDLARCFGHHRQQSVRYALHYCLACHKLKQCVRATWGVDRPRRARRDAASWPGSRQNADEPVWTESRASLAT
jgi:hypothetical protein